MNYFLFLKHPKGKEVYKVNKENEEAARKYFKTADLLETEALIEGKKYKAFVDYEMFGKLSNFDCFNCTNDCCADSPSKLKKVTKDFLMKNLDEFNSITGNMDIAEELGYEDYEILENIKNEENGREIIEEIEENTEMCFYAYRKNRTALCSIHSMCLNKNMNDKEIACYKPLICSLWPIEILSEDDNSILYITLPDDFTNRFTIENYYEIPCINQELSESSVFRRKNPDGFERENYKPLIESYKDTIINNLGKKFYEDVLKKLSEE